MNRPTKEDKPSIKALENFQPKDDGNATTSLQRWLKETPEQEAFTGLPQRERMDASSDRVQADRTVEAAFTGSPQQEETEKSTDHVKVDIAGEAAFHTSLQQTEKKTQSSRPQVEDHDSKSGASKAQN